MILYLTGSTPFIALRSRAMKASLFWNEDSLKNFLPDSHNKISSYNPFASSGSLHLFEDANDKQKVAKSDPTICPNLIMSHRDLAKSSAKISVTSESPHDSGLKRRIIGFLGICNTIRSTPLQNHYTRPN